MKITNPVEQQQLVQEIRDLLTSYGYENMDILYHHPVDHDVTLLK